MPLVTNKATPIEPNSPYIPQTPKAAPQLVKHAHESYRGITVDTRYVSRQNLIMHVEGSPWSVDYYSQVLGKDSATQGQGTNTLGIHQQYKLIKRLELRVTSPLSSSQNDDTKEMTHTGSANMYPHVTPNEGDMFLADIGDGREGVFQVTSSSRKSIHRETVHEIEYTLIDYSDNGRKEDLAKKTIQTFYFQRDFIKHGHNPLIYESEFEKFEYLRDLYPRLVEMYLRRYYSKEFSTLLVPDQSEYTYDIYLTRMFNSHFGRWDSNTYKHIRILNADEDEAMQAYSVWNALEMKDRYLLQSAFHRAGIIPTIEFNRDSKYDGIRFSGVKKAIYPFDPMYNVQNPISWKPKSPYPFYPVPMSTGIGKLTDYFKPLNDSDVMTAQQSDKMVMNPCCMKPKDWLQLLNQVWPYELTCCDKDISLLFNKTELTGFTPSTDLKDILNINYLNGLVGKSVIPNPKDNIWLIHPPFKDGYYVFSKAFYENDRVDSKQSKIELLLQDYLDNKAISFESVYELAIDSYKWNSISGFYYIPVLLLLIKTVIHAI